MTSSIVGDESFASSLWSAVEQTKAAVAESGLESTEALVESRTDNVKMCVFMLGTDRYALDVTAVGEVCPRADLNPVPLAPTGVLGLHNLRGRALAVVDLAEILALEVDDQGRRCEQVLVLLAGGMEVGAPIHQVEAIEEVDFTTLTPVDHDSSAILGVIALGKDRHATVLDPIDLSHRLAALSFQRRRA